MLWNIYSYLRNLLISGTLIWTSIHVVDIDKDLIWNTHIYFSQHNIQPGSSKIGDTRGTVYADRCVSVHLGTMDTKKLREFYQSKGNFDSNFCGMRNYIS